MKSLLSLMALVGFAALACAVPTSRTEELELSNDEVLLEMFERALSHAEEDEVSVQKLKEIIDIMEQINRILNKEELDEDNSINYGFGKKLRKALKKAGRVIEKAGKKVLEHGVHITVPIAG